MREREQDGDGFAGELTSLAPPRGTPLWVPRFAAAARTGVAAGLLPAIVVFAVYFAANHHLPLPWVKIASVLAVYGPAVGASLAVLTDLFVMLFDRAAYDHRWLAPVANPVTAGALGGTLAGIVPGAVGVTVFGSYRGPFAGTALIASALIAGSMLVAVPLAHRARRRRWPDAAHNHRVIAASAGLATLILCAIAAVIAPILVHDAFARTLHGTLAETGPVAGAICGAIGGGVVGLFAGLVIALGRWLHPPRQPPGRREWRVRRGRGLEGPPIMRTCHRRRTVHRAALVALALAPALTAAAACGARTPAQSPPPSNTATPVRAGIPLIAANRAGVFEITREGREVRQLSKTAAQQPRWVMPGRRLVFLTADAAELRSLDLETKQEQTVARVRTRLDCPSGGVSVGGPDPGVSLSLHDDDDFVVQSGRACLRLMDRNANMADFILVVRVDLATGRAEEFIPTARDTCKVPRREAPPCGERPLMARLPEATELAHAGPAGFTGLAMSPSGRWALLRGKHEQGDYLYDQIALYEVATRRTFPIVDRAATGDRPWPAPLTAEQLAQESAAPGSLIESVIAEAPVYWLPGPDDRLVVDGYLIVPGVRIVFVGDLAPPP